MAIHQSTLTRLVYRLEAATSRLEDIASVAGDSNVSTNGVPAITGPAAIPNASDLPNGKGAVPKHVPDPLPPAIDNFDALLNGDVNTFVNMSEQLGGLIAEQVGTSLTSNVEKVSFPNIVCIVGLRSSSLCCGTKIFDRNNEGEEARHTIPGLHGSTQGIAGYDGVRE